MNRLHFGSLVGLLSAVAVAIHLIAAWMGGYGIFRDELYYVACANHLDIGYVDHPPLSIWVLAAWKLLFGESLFAIRVLPGVCSGIATFIVGVIARGFGGEKYAVALACLAFMFAPILLAFFGLFSMNSFDVLLWALAFLTLQRLARDHRPADWYRLGLVVGLGALNKISMLWLGAGIFIGFVLTPNRAALKTKRPWLAGSVAAVLFLPFMLWNITHDFAHLEFIRNASAEKYVSQNPATFFSGLLMLVNPLAAPLWLAGFWFLIVQKGHRVIGIAVMVVLALLLLNVHSKPEYFASAMTALLPAGAVQFERTLKTRVLYWTRIPYLVCLMGSGVLLMPLTVDVLPIGSFLRYQSALGLTPESNEGLQLASLPQHYADRFGWEHMADVVAQVYAALPDTDRHHCLIYGRNYGEAGAIDFFGREAGLPPAISQHNSYWYWSLEHLTQDAPIIVIGLNRDRLAEAFEEVQVAAVVRSDFAMPYENNLPVLICRRLRMPILEFWSKRRVFI